jgi:hypothetical protein
MADDLFTPKGKDSVEKEQLEDALAREYSSHQEQLQGSQPMPERVEQIESSLIAAYKNVIEYRQVPFVRFGDLNAAELASAFVAYPMIIKPTLCCVNVAQRAISRDLGFDFNTYSTKISADQAKILAGYIKPFLPPAIAIPALVELDRYFWTDKELRAHKGNWERGITEAINSVSTVVFRKRMFSCDREEFEIDAAYPAKGEPILIGVDIKRIESPRDIHKRADEIINKATKFKKTYPGGKFVALVYYPFPSQHINAQSRLQSTHIDGVFFAGETKSSIENAAEMLVGKLGVRKKDPESP